MQAAVPADAGCPVATAMQAAAPAGAIAAHIVAWSAQIEEWAVAIMCAIAMAGIIVVLAVIEVATIHIPLLYEAGYNIAAIEAWCAVSGTAIEMHATAP